MFGGLHFPPAAGPPRPPKDVPPPTPVNFPSFHPRLSSPGRDADRISAISPSTSTPNPVSLTRLLQEITRPTDVAERYFDALGVHVTTDARLGLLIPDPSVVPDFAAWEAMSHSLACDINFSTRLPISNGNLSPGVMTFQDRLRELSIPNDAAYRSIRRLRPNPGQPAPRLGNSYDFFRHLEILSTFWDDTSVPPGQDGRASTSDRGGQGAGGPPEDQSGGGVTPTEDAVKENPRVDEGNFYRSQAGNQMPPRYRLNVTNAFLKLVAYDFGCSVTGPATEPRLYLNNPSLSVSEEPEFQPRRKNSVSSIVSTSGSTCSTPAVTPTATSPSPPPNQDPPAGPSSYFTSDCTFIFRTPTTREAARSGIGEGPLAAVSARHTTSFPPPSSSTSPPDIESLIDLAREVVAALVTAQHRAREGRFERRIGRGAWWSTRPRWGGGTGGPIGREVELIATREGVTEAGGAKNDETHDESARSLRRSLRGKYSSLSGSSSSSSSSSSSRTGRSIKSRRTTLAIYDSYRMVRPPSAAWDRRTKYMAVGRPPGVDYDDIFVVSALFHHVSLLRVRVPIHLLDVLDGKEDGARSRSWGRVEVYRTRWYDLFRVEDRVEAMKMVWAVMSYQMRKVEGGSGCGDGDVVMAG